ncbi:KAD5-like protein [Mya arenaria]|uniref:KAD5-like protein n=1 Tax=Mya arenaria TaxID=6604 RepID=A0ABY7EG40_MYAAR|nr:KAD5-like protein [Mya arenaria]
MTNNIVNAREAAKMYLSTHNIPQMFESLLSCLMVERPEDPVAYVEKKMGQIREIGVENVNWESFVRDLHPYRDPVRLQNVRDGSTFDRERETPEAQGDGRQREKSDYQPDETRRRQMVAAAEQRQKANESRGLKDPEAL